MTPHSILDRLVALFPEFAPWWDDPGNCFREDDGSFTRCGVFAEFSSFFRERYGSSPPSERLAVLGDFVTDCVASSDEELSNAVSTCFLECVSGERFHEDFLRLLNGEARRFYSDPG